MAKEHISHPNASNPKPRTILELENKLYQHEAIIVQLVEIIGATNRQLSKFIDRHHKASSYSRIRGTLQ